MTKKPRRKKPPTVLTARRGGGAAGSCACCHSRADGIVTWAPSRSTARTSHVCDFHLSMATVNAARFFSHLNSRDIFHIERQATARLPSTKGPIS